LDQIYKMLQTMFMDHMAAKQLLMQPAVVGDTIITVANSSRFRPKREAFIVSESAGLVEKVVIKSIPDWDKIELATPLTRPWPLSENAYILRATNHIPLQRVYIGNLPSQPNFPCITIQGVRESNEWSTLEATSHEYRFSIKCFVMADNAEASELYLPKFATEVREVLMDHIHPIVDGVSYPITTNVPAGATVISLATTAGIPIPGLGFIRDAKTRIPAQESVIKTVLSATDIEVVVPLQYDYQVARGAEMVLMNRYLFDTRADSIEYGYLMKNTSLLRAAEISWYAKEEIIRPGNILT
jgi:hypothetical protein